MARFLLLACLASTAVATLLPSSPAPSRRLPDPPPPGTPVAPAPRLVVPPPPGFLFRVGVARNTDPPEVAASLAGFPTSAVRRIVFSPDGRLMLTSGSSPGSSRVWRNLTDAPFAGLDHEETHPSRAPHFSPDGRLLVGVSGGRLAAWDAETGVQVYWAPDPAEAASCDRAVGFDADGTAWGFHTASGTLTRQRLPDGANRQPMMGHAMTDFALLSPNGARLAVGGAVFAVRSTHPAAEWHIVSALPVRRRLANRGGRTVVAPLAFSPSGRLLVTGSARGSYLLGQFTIWDVTERPVSVAEYGPAESEWLLDATFSPCGRWLAFHVERPGGVFEVRVWEVATLTEAWRFTPAEATAFAFHPDARRLVVGHADSTVSVWDRPTIEGSTAGPRLPRDDLPAALADANPKTGLAAIHALLAESPPAAVAFLRDQFRPLDRAKAADLIAALDDDDFGTREEATKELATLGPRAEPALRRAATTSLSPEVRSRADKLLGSFVPLNGRLCATHTRAGRAVEVLERLATPEAVALLEAWTAENPGTHLGTEAKAALGRLRAR